MSEIGASPGRNPRDRVLRRSSAWVLFLAVVFAGCQSESPPSATSQAPSAEQATVEHETWEVVFLKGERVGYTHTVVHREPRSDGDVLRIEHEESLTLLSYGNLIESKSTFTSIETPDGRLLEFTSVLPQGEIPMTATGKVVGNELKLEVGTKGPKTEATLPWEPGLGGPYQLVGSLRDAPLAPGEKRTLRYLDISTNQPATTVLNANDYQSTDLVSASRRLLQVQMQTSVAGQEISGTLWTDENGEIFKTRIPDLLDYVAIRTTEVEATQPITKLDFDLGKGSAVAVATPLPEPHETRKIVYRVHLKSGNPAKVFDSGHTQRVDSEDDQTARITVDAVRPGDSGNPQATPETAIEGDIQPNALVDSDDPTVVLLAQQAAGQIDDPWRAAVALEGLVNERMVSQGISSAFATAGEVARSLRGDCTEHAVLLAALARARDIPARVAIGLVYFQGQFLYHMWTEVYIDGAWLPIDGTLGRGGIGAAHLKITDTNLAGVAPQAAFLPVTEVIEQLEIEILEVVSRRP